MTTRYLFRAAVLFFVLAICEMLFHWLLGRHSCAPLMNAYQLRAPNGGGMFILPDIVFPAILVGVWNGRISKHVPAVIAQATALCLGIGIVLLLLSYPMVMPNQSMWWRGSRPMISAVTLAGNALWCSLIVAGITTAYLRSKPWHI